MTANPDENWMKQIARNITMPYWGFLKDMRYLIHERAGQFCESFRSILKSVEIKPLKLPPQSPNLNLFAER